MKTTGRNPIVVEPAFSVGDWVRPKTPEGYDAADVGMVISIEVTCDLAGTRVIYEVRPRKSCGSVSADVFRFREQELEEAP